MVTEQTTSGAETSAAAAGVGGEGASNVPETSEPQVISLEEHNRILAEYRAAAKAELDAKDAVYGQESQAWGAEKKKTRAEAARYKALADEAALSDERQAIAQRRYEAEMRHEEAEERERALQRREADSAGNIAVLNLKARFPGLPDSFYAQAKGRMMRGPLETQDVMLEAEGLFRKLPQNKTKPAGAEAKPAAPAMPTNVPKGSPPPSLAALLKEPVPTDPKALLDYQRRWAAALANSG